MAIACAYAALAVIVTWPLASQAATHLPKDLGDPLLTAWLLAWHAQVPSFTGAWWNGAAFFPVQDTLALSDHRLGLSVVATPVQWLGGTPALAYNLTLLAGIALSALAAHALAYRLTDRHDAALIAGIAFGAAPYRLDHLEHLELVCTWWLPIVFLGLHAWRHGGSDPRRHRWLLFAAVAWMLQGLTGGYYFVFGFVLLALWLAWFVPPAAWRRDAGPLVAAFGVAMVPLLPILWRYHELHERFGLSRSRREIELFSADLTGLLSRSAWLDMIPALASLRRPEGQLYPGLILVALVAVALWRRRGPALPAPSRGRRAVMLTLAAGAGAALTAAFASPWHASLAGITISVTHPHKPVTLAMVLLAACGLSSLRARDAWRRRSPLAFYALAALACWTLALGPTPRVLGERFWYKAPYEWLMRLPGFADGFRVPARYGMLAALALSVAAALAYSRLVPSSRRRGRALALAAGALILVDVWPGRLTIAAVPALPDAVALRHSGAAAVLELPLGPIDEDTLALYRTLAHGLPVLNGYSGHEPPHYALLRIGLAERDASALDPWRQRGPLLVGHADDEVGRNWMQLTGTMDAREVAVSGGRRYLLAPGLAPAVAACSTSPDRAEALPHDWRGPWMSPHPQAGGETITIDLGRDRRVCGLRLLQGRTFMGEYPRLLLVERSQDGRTWMPCWEGRTAGLAIDGVLRDPARPAISIPVSAADPIRYLRLRQQGRSTRHWAIGAIEVAGR